MALTLNDLKHKVDNNGATPEGRYPAEEYNTLLDAVKTAVADILKNAQSIDDVPDLISQATNNLFEFFAGTSYDFKGLATPDKPMTAGGLTSGRSVYLLWQPGDYSYLDANGDLQQLITLTEPTLMAAVIRIPIPQVWEIFSITDLRNMLGDYFAEIGDITQLENRTTQLENRTNYLNTFVLLFCDATVAGYDTTHNGLSNMIANELGIDEYQVSVCNSPYVKLQYQGVSDPSALNTALRAFDWVNIIQGMLTNGYTTHIYNQLRQYANYLSRWLPTNVANVYAASVTQLLKNQGGFNTPNLIILIQGGLQDVYGTPERPTGNQRTFGPPFRQGETMWDVMYDNPNTISTSLQWILRELQGSGYPCAANVSYVTPVYTQIGGEPDTTDGQIQPVMTLGEFVDQMKMNCGLMHVPVCDLYNIGVNAANYTDLDAGYQPSQKLMRHYARKIAQHIREYYPNQA